MPTILRIQQWKMIKNFDGEATTRHPVGNPVVACPTKQKSKVAVSFKHGDQQVEEAPLEPNSNIGIISITIQVPAHQRKSSEDNKKRRKANATNTQQRLHSSTNNIKETSPQESILLPLPR